jgi:hypothetical protein
MSHPGEPRSRPQRTASCRVAFHGRRYGRGVDGLPGRRHRWVSRKVRCGSLASPSNGGVGGSVIRARNGAGIQITSQTAPRRRRMLPSGPPAPRGGRDWWRIVGSSTARRTGWRRAGSGNRTGRRSQQSRFRQSLAAVDAFVAPTAGFAVVLVDPLADVPLGAIDPLHIA